MMPDPPFLLEADGIWLQFGDRKILQSVYLRLEVGKVTGLLGRNGAGKTSLLRSILGLMPTESQSVRVNGRYMTKPFKQPGLIRYLPQHPLAPASLTVRRAFDWYGVAWESVCDENPGAERLERQPFGALSGGERRWLETLLVLKSDVAFVLLDEPFSHVMPLQVEHLRQTIEREKARKGILISDHLYRHVLALSDSVYFLTNGGRTMLLQNPESDLQDLGYLV